ncbi:MAG: hypothetical protein IMZ44_14370 [Planctomycetes bacterium]|nr:hypothetical protein [Planctomycetota bacterium]
MACCRPALACLGAFIIGAACAGALALDPRRPGYEFTYTLYPPSGFSVKKSKAVPRPDPKDPKAFPIIGKDGKFTDLGQWYYAIGSDPKNFENDGAQALLAIAQGRIHKDLKTPKGQQVPGRYDFDPKTQAQRIAEDEVKLDPRKEKPGSDK